MVRKNQLILALLLSAFLTHFSTAQLPGCATTVNTFPYTEGFESNMGNWSNVTGDTFDWTRNSGGTPSTATGPTGGSGGSTWYMYIETSGPVNGATAWLVSDCFDFTALANPTFQFDYHMYGSAIGSLQLQASTDGTTWNTVWSLSADQGNFWNTASVNLGAYGGQTVGFRFIGTKGTSFTSDIAIDDIYIYNSLPMTYASSTCTQTNTSDVENCSTDAEIIGIEVVTTGSLTPIDLTQLVIRTDGTTAPLSDIVNMDVYFSGTSSSFSSSTLFGSAAPAANGVDILVNGTQTLSEGTNYFWLVYDISVAAPAGNFVDAQCTQLTVDGASYNPTVTSPAGNREIIDCARACPTTATILNESFETAPVVGWIPGTTYGSNYNGAVYIVTGSYHGWFNLQNGLSNLDVYDRYVDGLYVGCEVTVSYWARKSYGVTSVEFNMYDDNGALLAQNIQTDLSNVLTQYTHTFTATTPGMRFVLHFNSTGGSGIDVGMDDLIITQCCDMPTLLPVNLTEFNASCGDDGIDLTWETATENNNDYFSIERSRDGQNFEVIATVDGRGTTTSPTFYSWTDENPIGGMTYYRLSQTDYDGTIEIFQSRSVDCAQEESFDVHPNPFDNELTVTSQTEGVIALTDVTGSVVLEQAISPGQTNISTTNLAVGAYLAKITLTNGQRQVRKLIRR